MSRFRFPTAQESHRPTVVQYRSNQQNGEPTNLHEPEDSPSIFILNSNKNVASALAGAIKDQVPSVKLIRGNNDPEEKLDPILSKMFESVSSLFPGEKLIKIQPEVRFSGKNRTISISGDLFVTNFRIFFLEKSSNDDKLFFDFPIHNVGHINKIGGQTRSSFRNGSIYGLEFICKDFRRFFFAFVREARQRSDFFDFLNALIFPISIKEIDFTEAEFFFEKFFAPNYKNATLPGKVDPGWKIYDRISDFHRMGLKESRDFFWRIDKQINKDFAICDTYPEILVVPAMFSRDRLKNVAAFRSRNRFPVLSWYSSTTFASICRSSQPLTGLNRKSSEDLDYLETIGNSCVNGSRRLFIIDARPRLNAHANKASGGGFEDYSQCDFEFENIENIHEMRESLNKLNSSIEKNEHIDENEKTSWLFHIRVILTSVFRIVRLVEVDRRCVLVHCSDGWDRTAQLTSLSMLLLDGFYRTFNGFLILIEKEWISFGHKFLWRLGHGEKNDHEQSPVFLQFLDCTFQLMEKFADRFEFNEKLLIEIGDSLYNCQFGTFLLNSDKQRKETKIEERTVSLWTKIIERRELFLNENYRRESENQVLIENFSSAQVKLWKNYFFKSRSLRKSFVSKRQLNLASLKEKFSDLVNSDIESLPATPRSSALDVSGTIDKSQMKNPLESSEIF